MQVCVGKYYRHFKGKIYKVLAIGYDTEIENRCLVVYEAMYDEHKIWVRPIEMFSDEVDHDKYPDVKQKYRFEEVEYNE